MTQHEFTVQENTETVWNAALAAITATEDGQQAQLLGQRITTVPPDSQDPKQITLRYTYDGAWRDVYRTLALTAQEPVSYQYEAYYWGAAEGDEAIDEAHGPAAPETIQWLGELANDIRARQSADSE